MADAIGAGETAVAEAKLVAARRADQPSRSRSTQLAGRISAELSQYVPADLARPLFSGCDRQQDCRDLEQAFLVLQRELRQIPGAEDAAQRANAGRIPQPARPHRATGSLHQPFSLSGDQSQAGAEPDQGT